MSGPIDSGPRVARRGANAARQAMLCILLVAFGVRLIGLDTQSLWYDEAVTAQVTARGLADLTRWTAGDIQPPLYYYLVAGWTRLAGRSEWALRFPSVFFGTLTVSLLWALGRRLFSHRRSGMLAGILAALLACLSPLYVYYSQEARMYTLLTALAALTGYALLKANSLRNESGRKWWPVATLSAVALLYTHYFGAFLLVAYTLCAVLLGLVPASPRSGHGAGRSHRKTAVAYGALAVLLYLPWLPVMLARYEIDRSYWQGSLKLGEALRHLAVSFTAGAPETMLEGDAVRLLPWFGLTVGICLGALIVQAVLARRHSELTSGAYPPWLSLAVLLITLAVPVLGVLALASRTPKFNARYLMLVSPAYLLILAGGLGVLLSGMMRNRRATGVDAWPVRGVATALLVFLLWVSANGLLNWFSDPSFTKAQWRELAASVRSQILPGESVLLVSGHAAPAWDYYAADIPRTPLPAIDVLDVNAILDFELGEQLSETLSGATGAWLVLWQENAVDPLGIVPYYLDRAGTETAVERDFWQLELRHWRLRPDAVYPATPRPDHVQGANFDHKLALLGWDDVHEGMLTLYWQALNTLESDYQVSLVLEASSGQEFGRWDGRPAGYDYPAPRWRPGQVVLGRYPLPQQGLPPGSYSVTMAVYDPLEPSGLDIIDVADNPAGKRVRLGPIQLPGKR